MDTNNNVNVEANNEDIDETEANNANADNEVEEPEQNIDFVPQEFTAVMNKSNVNSTSHGVVKFEHILITLSRYYNLANKNNIYYCNI